MTSAAPVTQIIHLGFERNPEAKLEDAGLWGDALNVCEKSSGFQRLYWGRSLEHPEHVELHLVRQSLAQHQDHLKSPNHQTFLAVLGKLSAQVKSIRHAQIKSWTPTDKSLARGAPVTGTAIYFNTTEVWNDYVWPLWTHVVRHIDGCIGCSGGPLLEPVTVVPGPLGETLKAKGGRKTFETGYVVYVGWETVEQHHAYHHTEHFAQFGNILRCGNEGFAEYGHVVFAGSREREDGKGARL